MTNPKQSLNVLADEAIIISNNDLQSLETNLGVPVGFLESLKSEDDWTFIIKSHALLEAALTALLAHHFGHPELKEFIEYLETSNTRTGKVALLSNQKILSKKQITFIRKFSELRNDMVHNVKNVSFEFKTYLSSQNKQKLKSIADWIIYYPVEIEVHGKPSDKKDALCKAPKFMIWMGLIEILSRITIQLKLIDKRN